MKQKTVENLSEPSKSAPMKFKKSDELTKMADSGHDLLNKQKAYTLRVILCHICGARDCPLTIEFEEEI